MHYIKLLLFKSLFQSINITNLIITIFKFCDIILKLF